MEMSRQRLRPSLGESTHMSCPRCSGMGSIRSVESMALAVLRLIGEEVRKERTTRVIAQLPVDVSTFLINEKREWLHRLESQRAIDIVLVPDPNMQTPNYSIRRVRDDETALAENAVASHHIAGTGTVELDYQSQADKVPPAAPAAVQQIAPPSPAPIPAAAQPLEVLPDSGFWSRLKWLFTGSASRDPEESAKPAQREEKPGGRPAREDRGGRRPHRGDRGERPDRGPRRDRDRNRHRDRDRNRDGERGERNDRQREPRENRDNEPRQRDNEPRNADRAAEAPRPQQPVQNPAPEQAGSEGEAQRRRRRRRGRGGRGGRDRQDRPNDTQPIAPGSGDSASRGEAATAAPDHPSPRPSAPEPVREPMPAMSSPESSPAPKSGESYTVWSSTPGEGQHFGPKD
jgi:ribonuclease E